MNKDPEYLKRMRHSHLKKVRENIADLNQLVNEPLITEQNASDSLLEAMAEITTHWRNKLREQK